MLSGILMIISIPFWFIGAVTTAATLLNNITVTYRLNGEVVYKRHADLAERLVALTIGLMLLVIAYVLCSI